MPQSTQFIGCFSRPATPQLHAPLPWSLPPQNCEPALSALHAPFFTHAP
jgi:hypothetical protein